MKKMLFVGMLVLGLIFGGNAWACQGGDCTPTVNSDVEPGVGIRGEITIIPGGQDMLVGSHVQDLDSNDNAGNLGTANVTLNANASATGKDNKETTVISLWQKKHGEGQCTSSPCEKPFRWHPNPQEKNEWEFKGITLISKIVPGESEAYGRNKLILSSDVDIDSNGRQINGLSYTHVKATTTLDINGVAWAEGTNGCPQNASIDLEGSLSSYAYGNSFSGDPNGAYANAGGSGLTTVNFVGHENDYSIHGLFHPNKAFVDFDSDIAVNQGLHTYSYVSHDGTTSYNSAFVGGGSAQLNLGSDGSIFGFVVDRDNIQLTGIESSGKVSQSGMAVGGNGGSVAYGNSSAYFSGAYGTVATIPGNQVYCFTEASPGQIANSGGYAVVKGYNNVSVQGNSITVTSSQYAKATTGNISSK